MMFFTSITVWSLSPSFTPQPQPQPAYQAPQNVSAASSDFSMLSDDDPELPF